MSAPDVDVAILGGGCAGLSLAVRLASSNFLVKVIEPREDYVDDRTWSFWRTSVDPFEHCVRKKWASWAVSGRSGRTTRSSSQMRYESIPSGAFYTHACELVTASQTASLSLGISAQDVTRSGNGWKIETDAGVFTAAYVVDTRPPKRVPRYGQFFLGREIKTERPVFDPHVVQLMQFRRGYSDGIDFVYVLPYAADQALVEVTSFAPCHPGADTFTNWLDIEIDALDSGATQVLRNESGALPMEAGFSEPVQDGIIRMGLGGGAARASTGYAFARIQWQADIVARALITGELPLSTKLDSPMIEFMDRVFLDVLATAPERGPEFFEALFNKVPRDRLERFLSGSTRASDLLSVMMSLPSLPFLRSAAFPV
jgi:lycopene beta-cyclase